MFCKIDIYPKPEKYPSRLEANPDVDQYRKIITKGDYPISSFNTEEGYKYEKK